MEKTPTLTFSLFSGVSLVKQPRTWSNKRSVLHFVRKCKRYTPRGYIQTKREGRNVSLYETQNPTKSHKIPHKPTFKPTQNNISKLHKMNRFTLCKLYKQRVKAFYLTLFWVQMRRSVPKHFTTLKRCNICYVGTHGGRV